LGDFFSNTSKKIVHEIDVCHCIEGGGKPEEFINLFANRTKAIHIKEFPRNQVEAFPGFIPDPIPLGKGKYAIPFGKGQANWKDIFNACKNNGGTEWYIAEFYMGKEDEQRGQDMIVAKQMVDFLKSYQ
jgi:sugar phosphate isomerase/epimerase